MLHVTNFKFKYLEEQRTSYIYAYGVCETRMSFIFCKSIMHKVHAGTCIANVIDVKFRTNYVRIMQEFHVNVRRGA